MTGEVKRYAIVKGARSLREVQAYLPGNYMVVFVGDDVERPNRPIYVIEGRDNHGWGLDSYVRPRFQSGLMEVEEIDLSHPIMKEVPA